MASSSRFLQALKTSPHCLRVLATFLEIVLVVKILSSHPVGMDGQNHIIAVTPLKFLPITEFEKSQKSFDKTPETELQIGFMSSVSNWLASWTPRLSWSRAFRQHQVGILSKFELHTENKDHPNESLVLRAVPPQSPK